MMKRKHEAGVLFSERYLSFLFLVNCRNLSEIGSLGYRSLLSGQSEAASEKSSRQTWREKTLRNVPIASIINTVYIRHQMTSTRPVPSVQCIFTCVQPKYARIMKSVVVSHWRVPWFFFVLVRISDDNLFHNSTNRRYSVVSRSRIVFVSNARRTTISTELSRLSLLTFPLFLCKSISFSVFLVLINVSFRDMSVTSLSD